MEEAIGCNSLILSMIDDELDNIWMKAEKPFQIILICDL